METYAQQQTRFIQQLEELWSMEQLILESMPAMIERVSDVGLKNMMRWHYAETLNQTSGLRGIARQLDIQIQQRHSSLFDSTLTEADDIIRHGELTPSPDLDQLIIAMCRKIEEYEIEQYSAAAVLAGELGLLGIQKTLYTILMEEKSAKVKLDFALKNITQSQLEEINQSI